MATRKKKAEKKPSNTDRLCTALSTLDGRVGLVAEQIFAVQRAMLNQAKEEPAVPFAVVQMSGTGEGGRLVVGQRVGIGVTGAIKLAAPCPMLVDCVEVFSFGYPFAIVQASLRNVAINFGPFVKLDGLSLFVEPSTPLSLDFRGES